jgi:hypothetical protein
MTGPGRLEWRGTLVFVYVRRVRRLFLHTLAGDDLQQGGAK